MNWNDPRLYALGAQLTRECREGTLGLSPHEREASIRASARIEADALWELAQTWPLFMTFLPDIRKAFAADPRGEDHPEAALYRAYVAVVVVPVLGPLVQ